MIERRDRQCRLRGQNFAEMTDSNGSGSTCGTGLKESIASHHAGAMRQRSVKKVQRSSDLQHRQSPVRV